MMKSFGSMFGNVKKLGAAGGYFPNFANSSWANSVLGGGLPSSFKASDIARIVTGASTTAAGSASKVAQNSKPIMSSLMSLLKKSPQLLKGLGGVKGLGKLGAKALLPLTVLYNSINKYNERRDIYKQGIGEALSRTALEAGLSLGGAVAGGIVGGTIGSLAGPYGTAVGGFAGEIAGGYYGYKAGSIYGDWLWGAERAPVAPVNPGFVPPPESKKSETSVVSPSKLQQLQKPYVPPNWQPIMGRNNASKAVLKARSEKETNAQLMRWAMGTDAKFKNYDKDYNYTGISDIYSTGGRGDMPGSRIDLVRQIGALNRQIKSTRGQGAAMTLGRQKMQLEQKLRNVETAKSQYMGKIGEGMGAQSMLQKAITSGETINGQKFTDLDLSSVQRVITNKYGRVVGYSQKAKPSVKITPKMESIEKELGMGFPTSVNPANLGKIPDRRGDLAKELGMGFPTSVNPSDLGKLNRTIQKEMSEADVSRNEVYAANIPDLVNANNPNGTAIFNTEEEPTEEDRKKAVANKIKNYGQIKNSAGGYFPNFADADSSNSININANINIAKNDSNIDSGALAAQVKQLLETEVPKLDALQYKVDRIDQVVNLVQSKNPGQYNLPPKQPPAKPV